MVKIKKFGNRHKKLIHVHIYHVVGKIEFDIEDTGDEEEALMMAMEKGKNIMPEEFGDSECEYISMIVEE